MKKALSKKNLWGCTPTVIKSTVGRVFGIAPPAWWLGSRFREHCKFLREAQRWSAERSREYQIARLREMLRLAYEKAPFCRRTFDSVGFHPKDFNSLDDMTSLPIIDKNTILENIEYMCTRSIHSRDVDYGSTGGTSGTPLHFYLDANRSSIEYAYLTESWRRVGYQLDMTMAVVRGRIVRPDRSGLYHEYDPILRHHYYSNFHMTEDSMRRYLRHIAGIGPCVLHAYPSSAYSLAKFITGSGEKAPQNVKSVLLESENVYEDQITDIEKAFGVRVFSSYGHSEKLVFAAECEQSRNYHIWPTYGYFELLDIEGKLVTEVGQEGEIVGTGFINTVMPFIRYRTGDWATYVGDRCEACGREHVIIRDIRGHRTQEVLIANDGSEISWTALNMHDDTFLNVRQFQFYQDTPGKAVLRVIPSNGFNQHDTKRIQRNLGFKLDGRLQFDIKLVDKIELSPRGKAIYVDQKIPQCSNLF